MKKMFVCTLLLLFSFTVFTQENIQPIKEVKWSNCILMNGLFGSSKTGIGLRYKTLYTLSPAFQIGGGVGIESYSSDIKRNFIPISFDLVGDVLSKKRTPFYMISVGYGIALKEDKDFAEKAKGGLMIDLSIGYRSKKYKSQPFIAAGYRFQNAFYEGFDSYGNQDKEVIYKRWSVSAGILF